MKQCHLSCKEGLACWNEQYQLAPAIVVREGRVGLREVLACSFFKLHLPLLVPWLQSTSWTPLFRLANLVFFNLSFGVMLEGGCSRFIGPVCETPYRSSVRRDTYFDILLVRKLMLTYQIIINIHWIKQDFFYPSGKIDKLVVGSADVDQSRIFSFWMSSRSGDNDLWFWLWPKVNNSSNLHVCDSACLDSRVLGAPPTRP